jgi:hypothetical protein
MKLARTFFFAVSIIIANAAVNAAQVIIRPGVKAEQLTDNQNTERDYAALVEGVFAPITDELNLTYEQKFRIVSIVTGTIFKADPLMTKLDELDDQINQATLVYPVDENRIRQLSAQEAEVMGQIITMKARARASMYQLLTPQQRSRVAAQFRTKPQFEGTLGAISN